MRCCSTRNNHWLQPQWSAMAGVRTMGKLCLQSPNGVTPVVRDLFGCATSLYQNEDIDGLKIIDQLGEDLDSSPFATTFATVLKQADRMIAVMTQTVNTYTRMWCVTALIVDC